VLGLLGVTPAAQREAGPRHANVGTLPAGLRSPEPARRATTVLHLRDDADPATVGSRPVPRARPGSYST
jgi:hypothetical protein